MVQGQATWPGGGDYFENCLENCCIIYQKLPFNFEQSNWIWLAK